MKTKTLTSRDILSQHVAAFNQTDEETIIQAIPNRQAEAWMQAHIPCVMLPDPMLEQTYYFRWWTFRKHIKNTPDGTVITEFLPSVPWAGKHNVIDASCCHHIEEGRWLRDTPILDEYITFLYRSGKPPRNYSNWLEYAVLELCEARGDPSLGVKLLPNMIQNHKGWGLERLHPSGLYWSVDDRDATEFSIGGKGGLRPTLNCYQVANARAISAFARASGDFVAADRYGVLAHGLAERINRLLWDEKARFYKALPLADRNDQIPQDGFAAADPRRNVREIWGYTPWVFGVAPKGRADAFRQLLDVNGFGATHGLTTAERRHPGFGLFYTGEELNAWLVSRGESPIGPQGHECLWNGPSWPFSTCLALKAIANLLDSKEEQHCIHASDYVGLLAQYARQHIRRIPDGRIVPWIDENLNPDTGDWIARTRLSTWEGGTWAEEKGGYERGKDYNHSSFCDGVIGGLFGVRPSLREIRISPLFPACWPYAVLEDVPVHGHLLTICYENPRLGGAGYRVALDGECVFASNRPVTFHL
ncbi:MAG: hypothetical protein FWD25_03140 [Clostridia bacterium]|nr:hypothetical protein [Clostridia bacterium]